MPTLNALEDTIDRLRWQFRGLGRFGVPPEVPAQWRADELATFGGWDFGYLNGRFVDTEPPWNYIGLARSLAAEMHAVLDMATGGGEVYSQILTPSTPGDYCACEPHRPNLAVAQHKLGGLGVDVHYARRVNSLPFADARFDLVLNRHGGFNAGELHRILASGGTFLSQQIAADHLCDLRAEFDVSPPAPSRDRTALRRRLEAAGFILERQEDWEGEKVFHDIGALVYFLRNMPWVVNGFRVSRYSAVLLKLQDRFAREGRLTFFTHRILLRAYKP